MKKGQVLTIIYMLLTIGIIALMGLLDPDLESIGQAIQSVNGYYLLLALACVLFFFFFDSLTLHHTTKYMFKETALKHCVKWMFIGNYYNALTPFSSGGQPMQAYYMKRSGVPVGYASSILVLKFALYQAVVCVSAAVSLAFQYAYLRNNNPSTFYFIMVGFAINGAAFLLCILAMVKASAMQRIAKAVVSFLHKIRIIKHREKAVEGITNVLEDFHEAARMTSIKHLRLWRIILTSLCQFFCYLAVTYFIYLSFGLHEMRFIRIIMMQAILYMSVSFFPLPGASGASESGFYLFFATIFPSAYRFVAMVLWRIFTYYLNIIVGVFVVLGDSLLNIFKKEHAANQPVKEKS